jgi:hypothetical protein
METCVSLVWCKPTTRKFTMNYVARKFLRNSVHVNGITPTHQTRLCVKTSIEGRLNLQSHSRSAGVEIPWALRNKKIQFHVPTLFYVPSQILYIQNKSEKRAPLYTPGRPMEEFKCDSTDC